MYSAGMARMRPWALGATLPMLKYLPEMSAGKPPLDKMLFQRAAKDGKTTGGLETPAEQIAAFEVFTQAEHIRILKDSLDELDRYEGEGRDLMEETLSAWLSGDEPRLLALMDAGFGSDPELIEQARRDLGLTGSYPEQYWRWISGVLQGDLGVGRRADVRQHARDHLRRRQRWGAAAEVHAAERAGLPGHPPPVPQHPLRPAVIGRVGLSAEQRQPPRVAGRSQQGTHAGARETRPNHHHVRHEH